MFNSLKKKNIFPLMSLYKTKSNHSSSTTNLCSTLEKNKDKTTINLKKKVPQNLLISSFENSQFIKFKSYLNCKKKFKNQNERNSSGKNNKLRINKNLYLTELYKNSFIGKNTNSQKNISSNYLTKNKNSTISYDSFEKNNSIVFSDENNKNLKEDEIFTKIKRYKLDFKLGSLIGKDKQLNYFKNNSKEIYRIKYFIKAKKKRLKYLKQIKKEEKEKLKNNYLTIVTSKKKIFTIKQKEISYLKYLSKYYEEQYKINQNLFEERQKDFIEVKNLMTKIEKLNKVFFQLKDIRNFLIKVKEKKNKLPYFFSDLELGKKNIENIDKSEIEKYKNYLNVNFPIFKNKEEFETIFQELSNNYLNSLCKIDIIQYEIKQLKIELMKYKKKENNSNNEFIDILQEKIKEYSQKNFDLLRKLKELKNIKKENSIQLTENENNKIVNEKGFEKNKLIIMNYHSILKNYNFTYSLLLEKLIEKIKYFLEIKIITKDIIYDLKISDVQINYIININISKMTQEKIYNSVLFCLKIYEKIIIETFNKHNKYLNSSLTKNEINQLIKKRKYENNIQNLKEKKEFIERRNEFKIRQLIEKSNKIYLKQYSKAKNYHYIPKKIKKQKSTNDIINKEEYFIEIMKK